MHMAPNLILVFSKHYNINGFGARILPSQNKNCHFDVTVFKLNF
jgi:hypothetical protein